MGKCSTPLLSASKRQCELFHPLHLKQLIAVGTGGALVVSAVVGGATDAATVAGVADVAAVAMALEAHATAAMRNYFE